MKMLFLALALACMPASLLADEIDDFMHEHLQRTHTPGAVVAVLKDGVLVRAQGYGYANLEHRVPVHTDTVFQSGSIGKMFTAVAVMLMVEDGKLRLDESIRTYLPDAPPSWQAITPRHLLTHTSGIFRNPGFDLRKDYTEDELLKIFYTAKLDFPAGQRFNYSNTAYALLGILVNKVGGERYIDVLKKRVFAPLNMHTAGQIDDRSVVPNRAAGYQRDADGSIVNQDWVAPTGNSTGDGALYLTVLDFAKWEAGVNARKVLKPESWAEMFKPVRLNSGKTYPYGFGWFLGKYNGHAAQYHSGSWQGFVTLYVRYLEENTAIVALTNSRRGKPDDIVENVARLTNPRLVAPAGAPVKDLAPKVTRRVRAIALANAIPAAEHAAFESPDLLKRASATYAQIRQPLGKLKELQLFGFEEPGDDRTYHYRGRFEDGFADIAVTFSPSGAITRFVTRPATSWTAPL